MSIVRDADPGASADVQPVVPPRLAALLSDLSDPGALATHESPLRWVIVVDGNLHRGLVANATACLAAAVGRAMPGVVGRDGRDATGSPHPGLPWTGCTVARGSAGIVRTIRREALERGDVMVVDMTGQAQHATSYQRYLATLRETPADGLDYHAVSLLGPRAAVDRLAGRLPLLS